MTMRLAIEHDIGVIVPILLYRLCNALADFDGFQIPDMQTPHGKVLAHLTAQDMYILFGGSSSLYSQSGIRLAQLAALDKSGVCKQHPDQRKMHSCTTAFSNLVRPPFAAPDSPAFVYRTRCPLEQFDQILAAIATEPSMCLNCKSAYTQETKAAKLQLWKDLPRIFNVVSALFLSDIDCHLIILLREF